MGHGMAAGQTRRLLINTRMARMTDEIIARIVMHEAWRRQIEFEGQCGAHHVLQPMRAGVLHGDEKAIEMTVLEQGEIGDVTAQAMPAERAHRQG